MNKRSRHVSSHFSLILPRLPLISLALSPPLPFLCLHFTALISCYAPFLHLFFFSLWECFPYRLSEQSVRCIAAALCWCSSLPICCAVCFETHPPFAHLLRSCMTLGNIPQKGQNTFILVLVIDLETLSGINEQYAAGQSWSPRRSHSFAASETSFFHSRWA